MLPTSTTIPRTRCTIRLGNFMPASPSHLQVGVMLLRSRSKLTKCSWDRSGIANLRHSSRHPSSGHPPFPADEQPCSSGGNWRGFLANGSSLGVAGWSGCKYGRWARTNLRRYLYHPKGSQARYRRLYIMQVTSDPSILCQGRCVQSIIRQPSRLLGETMVSNHVSLALLSSFRQGVDFAL